LRLAVRLSTAAAALLITAGTAGCLSVTAEDIEAARTAEATPAPVETTAPAEGATPAEEPAAAAECVTPTQAHIDGIAEGLVGAGNALTRAAAIRATEREDVWFIAAEIAGPGIEPGQAIGLWATNSDISGDRITGMTISVDGFAKEFSQWPDGGASAFALSQFEDGAQEALDCLR
jgi:hypothetical protein